MFETSFEVRQTAARRIFICHLSVWKCDQTGSFVFDTSLKHRPKYPSPRCIFHSLLKNPGSRVKNVVYSQIMFRLLVGCLRMLRTTNCEKELPVEPNHKLLLSAPLHSEIETNIILSVSLCALTQG